MSSPEDARLAALQEFAVAGTSPEPEYDRIAQLAAELFDMPIALVSFIDRDTQWLKARVGLDIETTSRELSFCARTIETEAPLVVPNALDDERFAENPLVTGTPHIRFYAGAPLVTSEGHRIGALCLIDTKPRPALTDHQARLLQKLAALVIDHLELRRLRHGRDAWQRMAATMSDAFVTTDERLRVRGWNAAAMRLFGLTHAQAQGRPLCELLGLEQEVDAASVLALAQHAEHRSLHVVGRRADGSAFPAEVSLSPLVDGATHGCGALIRDVSEQQDHEARLHELAFTDELTGLANRACLRRGLEAALAKGGQAALLLIDIDGFKAVNDSLGHSAGDALLCAISARLCWRGDAATLVARLGGDEFAVLRLGCADPLSTLALADAIRHDLAQPFALEDGIARVSASVGVALAPTHAEAADALCTSADLALYQAKAEGRNATALFAPHLRSAAVARHRMSDELRLALERDEFALHYQPQVRLQDVTLVGAEALLRWQHPKHGLLAPGHFLAELENHPIAAAVGAWVLREACTQAARWRRSAPDFRIAVNLFAAQCRSPNLIHEVTAALAAARLPAANLDLEITETIALRDVAFAETALHELHGLGVQIALDDFGTGYASLSTLKLPLHRLKIDRSFVRNLCENRQDAAIVRAVVQLGRSFGLAVLAEGVETIEQQQRLLAKGCTEAQGYLYGRPMPAEVLTARFGLARDATIALPRAHTSAG